MNGLRRVMAWGLVAGLLVGTLGGCEMTPVMTGSKVRGEASGEAVKIASVVMKARDPVRVTLEPAQAGRSETRLTVERENGSASIDLEGVRETSWSRAEDGSGHKGWVMGEEVDQGDAVRLVYEPPLPIVPDALGEGQTVEAEGRVTILRLRDGSQREAGSYRSELSVQRTEGGFRLIEKRTMDLNLADVSIEIRSDYDDRSGFAGRETRVRTSVFGVVPSTEKRLIRRSD